MNEKDKIEQIDSGPLFPEVKLNIDRSKGPYEIEFKGPVSTLNKLQKETIVKIVERLIELKEEYYKKTISEKDHGFRLVFHGKSEGVEKALQVIDGLTGYDKEIHKLIDNSRKG